MLNSLKNYKNNFLITKNSYFYFTYTSLILTIYIYTYYYFNLASNFFNLYINFLFNDILYSNYIKYSITYKLYKFKCLKRILTSTLKYNKKKLFYYILLLYIQKKKLLNFNTYYDINYKIINLIKGYKFVYNLKINYLKKNKTKKGKKGILTITFKKRNTFINISDYVGNTLSYTTVRKEGFKGRRRMEFISLLTTFGIINKKLKKYRLKNLAIIYKGWNRFRTTIKKSFLKSRVFWHKTKLNFLFFKFYIKIPFNGCRPPKKKRKKRKKKAWLKKLYKKFKNNY